VADAAPPELAAEEPVPIDPIPGLNDAFRAAMAQNDVLRPAGASAVDFVSEMLAVAPEHTLSIAARDMLITEMLDRSAQSIEARDTRAAQTWIDSAAPLADPALIARAQDRLTQHLIVVETARLVPASELRTVRAAPPEFPTAALDRGIEGWVEIEFVVAPDGETEDVTVTDASHERYFRQEAIAAVDAWRFEPVVFLDRAIPKRASTRLEFVID
jgi:TonB family protein